MAKEIESVASELVSNRMEEFGSFDPKSRLGKELIKSAQMDAEDLARIANFLKIGDIKSARRAIGALDTVARDYLPEEVFHALFPGNRLEEDFKKTISSTVKESNTMKVSLTELKAMIREALKEQSAKGAGVNTAIAPPTEKVTAEQISKPGRKRVFEITGPMGHVEAYAAGTDEEDAKVRWLVSIGQTEASARNNMHHYGASAMSTMAIQKMLIRLEDQIEKLEARKEQLEAAASDF